MINTYASTIQNGYAHLSIVSYNLFQKLCPKWCFAENAFYMFKKNVNMCDISMDKAVNNIYLTQNISTK